MLNTIMLQGRLTSNPEVKVTNSGTHVCTFCIACERNYAAQGGEKVTDFIPIVAWRGTADFVEKFFTKGKEILVSGALETRKYQDKDGVQRTLYEVNAEKVYFCGSKNDNINGSEAKEPVMTSIYDDDEDDTPF